MIVFMLWILDILMLDILFFLQGWGKQGVVYFWKGEGGGRKKGKEKTS